MPDLSAFGVTRGGTSVHCSLRCLFRTSAILLVSALMATSISPQQALAWDGRLRNPAAASDSTTSPSIYGHSLSDHTDWQPWDIPTIGLQVLVTPVGVASAVFAGTLIGSIVAPPDDDDIFGDFGYVMASVLASAVTIPLCIGAVVNWVGDGMGGDGTFGYSVLGTVAGAGAGAGLAMVFSSLARDVSIDRDGVKVFAVTSVAVGAVFGTVAGYHLSASSTSDRSKDGQPSTSDSTPYSLAPRLMPIFDEHQRLSGAYIEMIGIQL